MKVGVIGVGALGSLFGGALAAAGYDVTLVIRNEAHRHAVQ
ncbi:MAG: 2-dehydropantoate 2-reductase N-terminal domain-containing protein, partial [Candidatus Puniceispirillum sp.]